LGWIVMARAIRHPGMQLALWDLGTLLAGFGLTVGGLLLMIWAERQSQAPTKAYQDGLE
jgi:hypothetical protein